MEGLSIPERSRLLQYCTGSARVPARGFAGLQRNDGKTQRFSMQSISASENMRLPRAHTCFNRIDVPLYSCRQELEAGIRLLIATDISGFTMD